MSGAVLWFMSEIKVAWTRTLQGTPVRCLGTRVQEESETLPCSSWSF
jgi:hypothetical protein